MCLKETLKMLQGKYWLALGLIIYLATAISSIIRTFAPGGLTPPTGILDIAYVTIDWLASCIIYFFIGAMLGFIADLMIARKNRQKIKPPLWLYLTAAIWIISSATAAIIQPKDMSPVLIAIFPLAFGIFFNGFAFKMLLPEKIVTSYYGKLLFDIFVLGIFAAWIHFTGQNSKKARIIARVLLGITFFILFLGFAGCMASLA